MADTKLRCALVYHLEDEPIVIAKYDHASQYETHAGTDQGTLYGGRDKNYADAVGKIIGSDPPSGLSEAGKIGGFKIVQSDVHQVVYGSDTDGICCAVVTGLGYPSRTAIAMLTELYDEFIGKFGDQALSAKENSLNKRSKTILSTTCKKYEDSANVDKAQAVLGKVEGVKAQMQDNIAGMLKNTEKAESLAEQSDQLNEQAAVFQKNSTALKKQMKCKNMKMTILLTGLVIGILLIILVPLIIKAKKS